MNNTTFDKVSADDPFEVRAVTWNALLEAGQDYQRRKLPGGGGPVQNAPLNPAVRVLVRNDTSGDLTAGSVLALGTPLITPAVNFREACASPVFPGTVPAAATDAFAVLLDPVAKDEIGRAVLMGVASCSVNVVGASDVYATPKASDAAKLESAGTGPARILWRESGSSGTKKALVMLEGYAPKPSPIVRCATAGPGTLATSFAAGQVVDGITLVAGDWVLLKDQVSITENGPYVVQSGGAPVRAPGYGTAAQIAGNTFSVLDGTENADTLWFPDGSALGYWTRVHDERWSLVHMTNPGGGLGGISTAGVWTDLGMQVTLPSRPQKCKFRIDVMLSGQYRASTVNALGNDVRFRLYNATLGGPYTGESPCCGCAQVANQYSFGSGYHTWIGDIYPATFLAGTVLKVQGWMNSASTWTNVSFPVNDCKMYLTIF